MSLRKMARDLTGWGLTQDEIAGKCKTSQTTISEILTGKRVDTLYSTGKRLELLHTAKKKQHARRK